LSTLIARPRRQLRNGPAVRLAARSRGQRIAEVENIRHLESLGARQQSVAQGGASKRAPARVTMTA
jgi:hypothetical protein